MQHLKAFLFTVIAAMILGKHVGAYLLPAYKMLWLPGMDVERGISLLRGSLEAGIRNDPHSKSRLAC